MLDDRADDAPPANALEGVLLELALVLLPRHERRFFEDLERRSGPACAWQPFRCEGLRVQVWRSGWREGPEIDAQSTRNRPETKQSTKPLQVSR